MKNEKTMVVVGGGYAGINLITAMKKEFHSELKKNLRIILIDKNSFHFMKVKLFKGIVNENVSDLHVPLKQYCGSVIEFIQGELIAVHREDKKIQINSKDGEIIHLDYDKLILAVGSVLREVDSLRGGITLNNLKTA
jgi:NADH dehydrogenase